MNFVTKLSEMKYKPQPVNVGDVYVAAQKTSDVPDMDIKHDFKNPVIAEYFSAGVQTSGYIIIEDKL